MGNREKWQFPYRASSLIAPAHACLRHEKGRILFWKSELEQAEARLRAGGLESRENRGTMGNDLEAVLDPTLRQRLAHCRQKLAQHQQTYTTIQCFLLAFELHPEQELQLQLDDLYFFRLYKLDAVGQEE